MTQDEVKQFQKAVGAAAWNLNLDRFAERIGSDPEHDYTREKFKDFSALSAKLSQFDSETLSKIVEGF